MQLFERQPALAGLDQILSTISKSGGHLVMVSGQAGIGKTSLLRSFLEQNLSRRDWVQGTCEALATPEPLAPLREIAAQLGGGLGSLFRLSASPDPLEVLQQLGAARQTVFVVEDMHWADQASLDLISFIGRRVGRLGKMIILTFRDDELVIDHPLRKVLGALATSRDVSRIGLQPLSLAGVRAMAAQSDVDVRLLYERTGGNPFFVAQVLAADGTGDVPHAVRDVIGERMARLGGRTRRFLQLLSVLGRVDADLLPRLSPDAGEDAAAATAVGLLRSDESGVTFSHDLVRQAVSETIAKHLAAPLHVQVLKALIDAGSTDFGRLAGHAEAAGDDGAIARYAPLAARAAGAAGARREAVGHYASALRRVTVGEARAELLGEYGDTCTVLDRNGEAIASYEEAAAIWRSLGNIRREAVTLSGLATPLFSVGRNVDAAASQDRAIALLDPLGPSNELASALRGRAQLHMLERDKTQALHFGRRAIRMADELGDKTTLAAANQAVAVALLVADDMDGRKYLERSMQLARENGLDRLLSSGLMNAGSSFGEQYRFEEAERYLQHGIAFAAEHDLDAHRGYDEAWHALVQLFTGDLKEADRRASALLAAGEEAAITRIMALVAIGRSRVRRGLPAREILDEALELAAPTGTLQRLAPVRLARAEMAWLAGDPALAAQEAEAVWALAVGHRHQWHAGEVAYWQTKAARQATPLPWIAPPYAAQLAGQWRAAAALWAARGCPYEQARALAEGDDAAKLEALGLFDALGARPAADMLRQEMRRSGADYVPRGPRPATRQHGFGLTARQQEIAALLAEGLTNTAISQRLKISAKTVEHHVSAILAKLDVATRAEVGGRLSNAGDTPPG